MFLVAGPEELLVFPLLFYFCIVFSRQFPLLHFVFFRKMPIGSDSRHLRQSAFKAVVIQIAALAVLLFLSRIDYADVKNDFIGHLWVSWPAIVMAIQAFFTLRLTLRLLPAGGLEIIPGIPLSFERAIAWFLFVSALLWAMVEVRGSATRHGLNCAYIGQMHLLIWVWSVGSWNLVRIADASSPPGQASSRLRKNVRSLYGMFIFAWATGLLTIPTC